MKRTRSASPFEIKVGILISYDYEYVYRCLPLIYADATRIVLAIDRKRLTWSGQSFELGEEFFTKIKKLDNQRKISIYEDDFFVPGMAPIECDTRERNLLAEYLGPGGWHVQVDSDEYFVDFPAFVRALRPLETRALKDKILVSARWFTLFRRGETGYFHVGGAGEEFPVATNAPHFDNARNIAGAEYVRLSVETWVIHQSWARSDGEIRQKIDNWGHTTDFSTEAFFEFWRSISLSNYRYIANFHPLEPRMWPSLGYVEGDLDSVLIHVKSWAAAQRTLLERSRLEDRARKRSLPHLLRSVLKLVVPPFVVILVRKLVGR